MTRALRGSLERDRRRAMAAAKRSRKAMESSLRFVWVRDALLEAIHSIEHYAAMRSPDVKTFHSGQFIHWHRTTLHRIEARLKGTQGWIGGKQ